jgi:hypothetical protein
MKWIRAKESLPKNGEETLIRSRGIFQLAVYNTAENTFIAKNGDRFRLTDDLVWSDLVKQTVH